MKRDTISFDEFLSLRSGDLVIWRDKYLRTVIVGPADAQYGRHLNRYSPRGLVGVELSRRKPGTLRGSSGWTKENRSATVTYGYSDMRRVIFKAQRRINNIALASEVAILEALTGSARAAMRKEIVRTVETNKRMGCKPCKCWGRILRLSRKPLPQASP